MSDVIAKIEGDARDLMLRKISPKAHDAITRKAEVFTSLFYIKTAHNRWDRLYMRKFTFKTLPLITMSRVYLMKTFNPKRTSNKRHL